MNRPLTVLLLLVVLSHASPARSSGDCEAPVIRTAASVTASDGAGFETESFYQSKEAAAIRHIMEGEQTIAVEGPFGWISRGGQFETGGDPLKAFALGHQFHAFLLHFEELVPGAQHRRELSFQDETVEGTGGEFPYGGSVYLVGGSAGRQPEGLRFEFPGAEPIEAAFSDWRETGGPPVPFHIRIDDGKAVFDYAFSVIELKQGSQSWFSNAVDTAGSEEVEDYRQQQRLRAGRCEAKARSSST